jgi:hypothetical protein
MRSTVVLVVAGTVALGAALAALRPTKPRIASAPAHEPAQAGTPAILFDPALSPRHAASPVAVGTVAAPAPAPSTTQAGPTLSDEGSLMAELHRLGETNPSLSLELAREGNDRFPRSADGAERGWILVKSLVNMGRFSDAKAEAEILVGHYRDTAWAADVERHLLSNPLGLTEDDP